MRTLALLSLIAILSGCTNINTKPTFETDSGAIRGYDPVAYFTEERPVKGSAQFITQHNGADWHFSSLENKELFDNNPEKYSPQYGGYCAYGLANGFVVSTDPAAFSLVNDKLYLNYSLGVRKTWLKDVPGNIKSADDNWLAKKDK